jgi:hypothetical protein
MLLYGDPGMRTFVCLSRNAARSLCVLCGRAGKFTKSKSHQKKAKTQDVRLDSDKLLTASPLAIDDDRNRQLIGLGTAAHSFILLGNTLPRRALHLVEVLHSTKRSRKTGAVIPWNL